MLLFGVLVLLGCICQRLLLMLWLLGDFSILFSWQWLISKCGRWLDRIELATLGVLLLLLLIGMLVDRTASVSIA